MATGPSDSSGDHEAERLAARRILRARRRRPGRARRSHPQRSSRSRWLWWGSLALLAAVMAAVAGWLLLRTWG